MVEKWKSKIKAHDFSQFIHTVFSREDMFGPNTKLNPANVNEVHVQSKELFKCYSSIYLPFLTFIASLLANTEH